MRRISILPRRTQRKSLLFPYRAASDDAMRRDSRSTLRRRRRRQTPIQRRVGASWAIVYVIQALQPTVGGGCSKAQNLHRRAVSTLNTYQQ